MLTTPSSDILCLRRFTFSAGQYNTLTNDGQSSTANFCLWLASSQSVYTVIDAHGQKAAIFGTLEAFRRHFVYVTVKTRRTEAAG